MKRLIVSGSSICALGALCALGLLASCSPGEGTLTSCTSTYVGSFEGVTDTGASISGPLIGQLDAINGKLDILARSEAFRDDTGGDAAVDDDGNLTPIDPATVRFIKDGKFDLDECSASGTWALGSSASGTWRLELPDSAF